MRVKKIWHWGWIILKYLVSIAALILILETFGAKGLVGFFGFCLLLVAWKIITKWQSFKDVIMQIETKIWGKPLSKNYWKKGELKNKKVKIVWRKKDGNKKSCD